MNSFGLLLDRSNTVGRKTREIIRKKRFRRCALMGCNVEPINRERFKIGKVPTEARGWSAEVDGRGSAVVRGNVHAQVRRELELIKRYA